MPPVVAVVAVVAAQAAVAAGIIAATTAALITAAVAAGSYLYARNTAPGAPSIPDAEIRQKMSFDSNAPHAEVYGTVKMSGPVLAMYESGGAKDADDGTWKGEELRVVQTISSHPITKVLKAFFGKEMVYDVSNNRASGDNMVWKFHNGPRGPGDAFLTDLRQGVLPWEPDMLMRNSPLMYWTGKYNREIFPRGFEGLSYLVQGKKLYDPRGGGENFSSNSALVILDFLLNVFDVPRSNINMDSFKVAANICDEQVQMIAADGVGGVENRYTCNGVYYHNLTFFAGLESMLNSCGGRLLYDFGIYSLIVGAYLGPAVKRIDESALAGDVSLVPWLSDKDHFNVVTGSCVDPEEFVDTDFPPVGDPQAITRDGRRLEQDVSFPWVTSSSQAQRLAKIMVLRATRASTLTWKCNFQGLNYEVGELIEVHCAELNIAGQEYMLVKRDFNVKQGIVLTLELELPEFYDDAIYSWPPFRPPTGLPDGSRTYRPVNLRFDETLTNNYYQGRLTWDHPAQDAVRNYLVEVWSGNTRLSVEEVTNLEYFVDSLDVGSYQFRIYAINNFGKASAASALSFNVNTPIPPNDCEVIVDNFNITLIPKTATPLEYNATFEFYYNSTYDEATKIYLGRARNLDHVGLPPDTTFYYWIRTVNLHGVSNFLEVSGKTTKSPDDILAVIGGHIGKDMLDRNTQDIIDQIDPSNPDNIVDKVTDVIKKTDELEIKVDDLENSISLSVVSLAKLERKDKDIGIEQIEKEYEDHLQRQGILGNQISIASAEFKIEANATEIEAQANAILRLNAITGDHTSQIARIDRVSTSNTQAIATSQQQLNAKINKVESDINEKFRVTIGYCVDAQGNITQEENATACVASGNTWREAPLADIVRSTSVTLADGTKGKITDIAQAFQDENGDLILRGGLIFDNAGRVSGIAAVADGSVTTVDIIADYFAITNPDTMARDLFYDATTSTLVIRGRFELQDGTLVRSEDDVLGLGTIIRYQQSLNKPAATTDTTTSPPGWQISPPPPTANTAPIWAITATVRSGKTTIQGSWSDPAKWSGEDGAPGSGFYAILNNTGRFPSKVLINPDFVNTVGRSPVLGDHLSYVKTDYSRSEVKSYNGTDWVAPTMRITGNLLVEGSITGDRIKAGTSITAPVINGGTITGVDGDFEGTVKVGKLVGSVGTATGRYEFKSFGTISSSRPTAIANIGRIVVPKADFARKAFVQINLDVFRTRVPNDNVYNRGVDTGYRTADEFNQLPSNCMKLTVVSESSGGVTISATSFHAFKHYRRAGILDSPTITFALDIPASAPNDNGNHSIRVRAHFDSGVAPWAGKPAFEPIGGATYITLVIDRVGTGITINPF